MSAARQWVRADSPQAKAYRGEVYGRVRASEVDRAREYQPPRNHGYAGPEEYEEDEGERGSSWPVAIFFCIAFVALMMVGIASDGGGAVDQYSRDGQWGTNRVQQTIVPIPGVQYQHRQHQQPLHGQGYQTPSYGQGGYQGW